MRPALDNWMKDTNDLGAVPEAELIERMWPGRKQPLTAAPTIKSSPAENGKILVQLACETQGASIGYRVGPKGRWLLYTKPITLETPTELTVKAVRIGYKPSTEIKKPLP